MGFCSDLGQLTNWPNSHSNTTQRSSWMGSSSTHCVPESELHQIHHTESNVQGKFTPNSTVVYYRSFQLRFCTFIHIFAAADSILGFKCCPLNTTAVIGRLDPSLPDWATHSTLWCKYLWDKKSFSKKYASTLRPCCKQPSAPLRPKVIR